MKHIILITIAIFISSCGYKLRAQNSLANTYPQLTIEVSAKSLLKRSLINAMVASGVNLTQVSDEKIDKLIISKDQLRKVVQTIGANNQVQEYRLEYDVEYTIGDEKLKSVRLEKDYSFDIQQIGGGQQEEITLRKQLAEDMAWAIIRQINAALIQSNTVLSNTAQENK